MEALTAQQALDLARLICPAWREERGCVIRADTYEPGNFSRWWAAAEGKHGSVEAGLNHLHLWDMLPVTDEHDYGELWDLGEVMVRAWQTTIARDFPGREFQVSLDDDYGPTVCVVSVRTDGV
ncbi:MAG TPA: hypothetical protein VIJ51_12080 [Solirubrobacteraceae bacterium]